jgi:hypothetical protein
MCQSRERAAGCNVHGWLLHSRIGAQESKQETAPGCPRVPFRRSWRPITKKPAEHSAGQLDNSRANRNRDGLTTS